MQTLLSLSMQLNSQNYCLNSVSAVLSLLRFPVFHMTAGTPKYNQQKMFFPVQNLKLPISGFPTASYHGWSDGWPII